MPERQSRAGDDDQCEDRADDSRRDVLEAAECDDDEHHLETLEEHTAQRSGHTRAIEPG